MLDSDCIPQPDAILRLLARGKDFISGVYHRRSPPHGLPVFITDGAWGHGRRGPDGLLDVDVVGAGCLLLSRRLLESLPWSDERRGKRWFDWQSDLPGGGMSEDFTLCRNARAAGHRVYVDPTVVCRHVGHAEAGAGTLKPLESLPVT